MYLSSFIAQDKINFSNYIARSYTLFLVCIRLTTFVTCDVNVLGCLKINVGDQVSKIELEVLYMKIEMDYKYLDRSSMLDRSKIDCVLIGNFLPKF